MKELQQTFPEASVELWATDQHRVGLKPILRRVWESLGSRPTVSVQHREHSLYIYSFVHPASGQTEWFLLPTVNAQVFTLALVHFAQAIGAGPKKRVLLVLDRAGWHTSQELEVPEGIHLLFLPPYSPELQPCEHLWPLTNEGVANRSFRTLALVGDGASGTLCPAAEPTRCHPLSHPLSTLGLLLIQIITDQQDLVSLAPTHG